MTIGENHIIKTILGRRSIRKFTADPVSPEIRDRLLECGCAAPSAHNRRPCVFVVIEDRKVLDDLAEAHDSGKMLRQAPLAIAVCAETAGYPEGDRAWVEDCAAALENILLAARGLGLEGVWLKVMDRHPRNERIRPILAVPDSVEIAGIAALGFGAERKPPYEGFDPSKVRFNRW
ncbi:Coenzyme F420:L-glutamate ligase [bioreactor metagenome]|jgi:nitroreductase|uniref:Coenzyme F420:L-glutamate ligase n=1 Tax=bioreactor metagenome TaxID=1076179 RepID=A0A644W7V5_9ZZZZ|nr:nitroreductase family protein [Aminivibrio sp.]MDD3515461.1 nitroreductase family protein [Synergistaceae bacterium]NCB14612.1 nitroreductase family protein [Synergistales bacterium]MEA4953430.1 nitroreductase family protein [Aminivibrio sp.]HPF83844.1 nitroreductase family protein [Aminivibrio sp.]HPK06998.1 nitroreductase family protein [Aminivibrio sp.]